jgi:hypothetical protein
MALDPVHPFKCFKNPVGAWIDGKGRAIAPENLPLLVDDEESPFGAFDAPHCAKSGL